jgi:hypothetical protein
MQSCEIIAWTQTATLRQVTEATETGKDARMVWAGAILCDAEQIDLAPWAPSGFYSKGAVVKAAAEAAIELAVIALVWPEEIGDVLRPSWDR